jgi:hypothetical protein
MKAKILAVSLMLSLASAGAMAKPSCAKGAVVGGVGGHFLGHHPIIGAAAGCAVGHHMSKKQERQEREAQARANQQAANQQQQQPAPRR